jgi:hypothetical protein
MTEMKTVELTEQEEREIRQYVRSQISDSENEVQLVQRVGRRRVAGYTHDLYDVWMSKGDRWWVITGMTNLYSQDDFHDLDQVFTFHLGLCALLREKFRIEPDDESAKHVGRAWRRYAKAVDAMSEAEEAEDFQAVGIRCREALLALIREHAEAEWLLGTETPPKAADFGGWAQLHAQTLASGRLRSYLRDTAHRAWDLAVWLQHYADATELDAEIVLEATAHFLRMFALAVRRYDKGSSRRCPSCDSYRLGQDGDVEERGGLLGYASQEVCLACGWASQLTFEPYSGEWFEKAAKYVEGDTRDPNSTDTRNALDPSGPVGSATGNGFDLDR